VTQLEGREELQALEMFWEDVSIPMQDVWNPIPPAAPDPKQFALGERGLSPAARVNALNTLAAYLDHKRDHMLGYQVTEDMNGYQEDLSRFLKHHLNNLGDPFQVGGYKVNTKVVEQAVLNYFAKLWHGEPYNQTNKESCWGYVLSMGSTEGNMYALWNARDYLAGRLLIIDEETSGTHTYDQPVPDPHNPNAYKPVVFYSEDTHYSFAKAVRVLDLRTFGEYGREHEREYKNPLGGSWPDEVPSEPGPDNKPSTYGSGRIDIGKLKVLVDYFAGKGHPIIVSLNFGSTFKGALDDVQKVCDTLLPVFVKHKLHEREVTYTNGKKHKRRGFWIHVDGALGAGYIPFLRMAADEDKYEFKPDSEIPKFDFGIKSKSGNITKDMVSSIALSGHKWMGAPFPTGVFMTKVKYQMQPPDKPEYIGSLDTTFAGSRNGFSPIVLWDHLAKHPHDRQVSLITHSHRMAAYLEQQLTRLEEYWIKKHHKEKGFLQVARSPLAITVRFRKPNARIVAKWSLSTVTMLMTPGNPETRAEMAHVFLMSSATQDKIDAFIADLHAPDAFNPNVKEPFAAPTQTFDGITLEAVNPFGDRGFA
jgi:histidine decarboxylase